MPEIDYEKIERYKAEMETTRLQDICYDLRMDHLIQDHTDSNSSDLINSLEMENDSIATAIDKYDEMLIAFVKVKRLYLNYQYYNMTFETNVRLINSRIDIIMSHMNELDKVYKIYIEFALSEIKRLKELVADPNVSWNQIRIDRRLKLIQEFNHRLIICTNLLKDCNTLQAPALIVLNDMAVIFNALNNNYTFTYFVKKFNELFRTQNGKILGKHYKRWLELLSNELNQMPGRGMEIYNKRLNFNEIHDTKPFEEFLIRWKNGAKLDESEDDSFTNVQQLPPRRKRKIYASVSVSNDLFIFSNFIMIEMIFFSTDTVV